MSKTTANFHRLVIDNVPLIDVRAPVEFSAGAFPTAVNLPLMNDEERHQVGICYKQNGQAAAIKLGHRLVCGPVKTERITAWKSFIETHPDAQIYCFRGGMRSQLSQDWAEQAIGREIPRLAGGYKAFRNYLIEQLEPHITSTPIILGGRTGSGKTLLLHRLRNAVDLEAIANHRGSSFGRFITAQPTQINFENQLAWALIQHRAAGHRHMIIEDEGRHVGRCYLPARLVDHFANAPIVLLEVAMERRVQITLDEYVTDAQANFTNAYGADGMNQWIDAMHDSLLRIRKRLGGERLKRVTQLLQTAFDHQVATGDTSTHSLWIELLLREYYDPMYDYQLEQKKEQLIFRGNEEAVRDFLLAL